MNINDIREKAIDAAMTAFLDAALEMVDQSAPMETPARALAETRLMAMIDLAVDTLRVVLRTSGNRLELTDTLAIGVFERELAEYKSLVAGGGFEAVPQ